MPNNNTNAHKLAIDYPGWWGQLMSPGGLRSPRQLPWALDNAMYIAWKRSKFANKLESMMEHWDGREFLQMLEWAKQFQPPLWVVVPDVPGDAKKTLWRFNHWSKPVIAAGYQPAIACQDGMTPDDVPNGVVAFIGGTTRWKWQNVERFCDGCEHVHVARVNTGRHMWRCHRAGVKSVDGTGWFRGDQNQLRRIMRFVDRASRGIAEYDQTQLTLI